MLQRNEKAPLSGAFFWHALQVNAQVLSQAEQGHRLTVGH